MIDKIREIRKFIRSNINRENGMVIGTDDFVDIYDLISFVNKKFNCSIEITRVGGFESPVYDLDCYAWAGIIEGTLYFDTLEIEYY